MSLLLECQLVQIIHSVSCAADAVPTNCLACLTEGVKRTTLVFIKAFLTKGIQTKLKMKSREDWTRLADHLQDDRLWARF